MIKWTASQAIALLSLALFLLIGEATASTTVPHTLNFSGYVTDQSGNPLNTAQDMKFLLSVNGSVVWCAEYTTVTATAGAISLVLGGTSQGGSALNNPASSCTSGGALTMSPSILNSVTSATPVTLTAEINDSGSWETLATPFTISSALFALDAETLGGYPSSSFPIFNVSNAIESYNGVAVIDQNGNWIGPAITMSSGTISGVSSISGLSTPSSSSTTDAANVGYVNSNLDGLPISGSVGAGQVLEYNGANWVPTAASGGTVTSVTGTAPVSVATGTTTPVISMTQSTSIANGWLSSSDWLSFNSAYTTVSTPETTNKVFAAPNGSTGVPSFRALAAADIPTISGSQVSGGTFGAVNGSALTNLNASNLSSGTVPVAELPILVGDTGTGGTAGIVPAPAAGTAAAGDFLRADGTWAAPSGATSGTVTSVAMTVPSFLSVTGSPITSSGTLAVSLSGSALPVANGGTNSSTALTNDQIMTSSGGKIIEAGAMTNGQLLIGNTGNAPTVATLTAGSGVTITNAAGGITIAATGSGGTVTSVTGTAPIASSGGTTPAISISQSTTSTNGYLSSTDWNTFNNKQAALTFSAPLSNSANTVSIPQATSIASGYLASGDWVHFESAYTTTSNSESANLVFASPNGSAGAPTFRALAAADIPSLSGTYLPLAGGTMSGNITMGSNTIYGSSASSGNITIDSTSNATKGSVILAPSGGSVGIGTSSPGQALDVVGNIQQSGSVFGFSGGQDTLSISGTSVYSNEIDLLVNATTKIATFRNNQINFHADSIITGESSGGIGTALTLMGGTSDSATAGLRVLNSGGGNVLYARDDGNVGIGTTSPSTKLHVLGTSVTPSSNLADGIFTIGGSSSVRLLFGSDVGPNYGMWMQTTDDSNSGASRPILLNPVRGNVGIGTTNPQATLEVNGTLQVDSGIGTQNLYFGNSGASTTMGISNDFGNNDALVLSAGYNGISFVNDGNSAYLASLSNTGNLWIAGTLTQASDLRFKKDIKTIENPMDKVLALRGVNYNFREDLKGRVFPKERQMGLIAQEVETIIPEIVSTDKEGFKSISYQNLVALLVESTKAIWNKITDYDAKLAALEKKNSELQAQFDEQKRHDAELTKQNMEILSRLGVLEHQTLASKVNQSHRGLASEK